VHVSAVAQYLLIAWLLVMNATQDMRILLLAWLHRYTMSPPDTADTFRNTIKNVIEIKIVTRWTEQLKCTFIIISYRLQHAEPIAGPGIPGGPY